MQSGYLFLWPKFFQKFIHNLFLFFQRELPAPPGFVIWSWNCFLLISLLYFTFRETLWISWSDGHYLTESRSQILRAVLILECVLSSKCLWHFTKVGSDTGDFDSPVIQCIRVKFKVLFENTWIFLLELSWIKYYDQLWIIVFKLVESIEDIYNGLSECLSFNIDGLLHVALKWD